STLRSGGSPGVRALGHCKRAQARNVPAETGRRVPALRRRGRGRLRTCQAQGSRRQGEGEEGVLMLVDSHCHLDFPELYAELDQVVARARAAGVGRMVTISTKVSEFDRVREIAERYPDVYCSVGIHPHEAGSEPAVDAERLAKLAQHPKVVGIGETGLDFF